MKYALLLLLVFALQVNTVLAQNATSVAQAIHYIKLANTLREVDKSQESISLLQRALPAVPGSLYWSAVANELMGLSYRDLNDGTNALRYLEKARDQYAKLKYVASAWGVNEVMRDVSGKNVYAGIQIGASDIKVAIFKTKYESDFYEKDIKSKFDVPNPTVTLVADASNKFQTGQSVLKSCLDSIQRYNIPNERVFIVFSNEVKEGLAKRPQDERELYSQLSQVLPDAALKIDTTLTATREAELFSIGAIPRKVWPTTSALNIGTASTTGGYIDPDKTFHPISVPYGVNSLVEQIESKRSLGMDAFRREAQKVVKSTADATLTASLIANNRGLQQRRTVGIGGDIAWALVTYLHPEKAGTAAIPITADDVERFRRLAMDDYSQLIKPDLKAIEDPTARATAEKDISTIQSLLNEKQLVAGALWLESITKAYNGQTSPKRFVFIRSADIGWVTGKFLETISNEYESTIAKGMLYTR
jgi:tetratricopeptide (TPR) repeat protein